MKCPKCGYTSFDYLDECKKCGKDLRDVRSLLQIIAVSPDDRAAAAPQPPVDDGLPAPVQPALEPVEAPGVAPEEEILPDMALGDSFGDLVEPTGYQDPGADVDEPPPAFGANPEGEDDDLLDLDFGDLFGDADKKDGA